MAKSKKESITLDRMPGADAIKSEDTKGFEVSLDFSSEEEVVFPEEGQEVEEVSEEDINTKAEEKREEAPEQQDEEEETADGEGEQPSEDEPSEEEVVSSDDAEVEKPEVKEKAPMVPKSRLDEVLAKQKALQKQLDDFKKSQEDTKKDAPKYDFAAKETKYQELVLDGKLQEATALRNEIRNAEREQILFEVQQKTDQTVQQSQEVSALQTKANEIQEKYTVFDQNSADYDENLLREAVELRDAYMVQGYSGPDALEKAVNITLTMQRPDLLNTTPTKTADSNVALLKERKSKAAISKNIEASKSQPPTMKGESASSRESKPVDLNKLSESEFNALPEETLRRLRGDFA